MTREYLRAEHPTLASVAFEMLDLISDISNLVHPAPEGSVWMQHIEFADRSEELAEHLRSALLLSESRLFPSALAVTRTALEHHLLDRLLLLADRYEETIRPVDFTQIEQWEREHADKSALGQRTSPQSPARGTARRSRSCDACTPSRTATPR